MSRQEVVAITEANIWTNVSGAGPAMVLCHGGPGSFDALGPVAEMVDDLVTVFRYDQRASGRSTGEQPYTVDRFVDDIEELRIHWNADKLIVAGHSWGANLALAYCLKYPQNARALIYMSGPGIIWDWQEEFKSNQNSRLTSSQQEHLAELKQKRHSSLDEEKYSNELLKLLFTADLADRKNIVRLEESGLFEYPMNWNVNSLVNADWMRLSQDIVLKKQISDLKVHALVIHGEADPRPITLAETMHQLLHCSELVKLPDVGHFPWLENPHLLQNALRNFLSNSIFVV